MNPFRYGALALDEAFTNREDEIRELTRDILNGQDVVVLAPRRYGKTSLVWRVMQEVVKKKVLVAQVNLMTTPTKERLAEKLADTIYEHIASASSAPASGCASSPTYASARSSRSTPTRALRASASMRATRDRTSTRRSSACSSCPGNWPRSASARSRSSLTSSRRS